MTWIMTRNGRRFDYANPTPDAVYVPDIAHALSNNCRFNGHTAGFFSVAQHTVEVAMYLYALYADHDPVTRAEVALAGLLHDAHEAYTCDFPTPLKAFFDTRLDYIRSWLVIECGSVPHELEAYIASPVKALEAAIDGAIFEALGVAEIMKTHHDAVKIADRVMLWSDALRWQMDGVDPNGKAIDRVWVPHDFTAEFPFHSAWTPQVARREWMNWFEKLNAERGSNDNAPADAAKVV